MWSYFDIVLIKMLLFTVFCCIISKKIETYIAIEVTKRYNYHNGCYVNKEER